MPRSYYLTVGVIVVLLILLAASLLNVEAATYEDGSGHVVWCLPWGVCRVGIPWSVDSGVWSFGPRDPGDALGNHHPPDQN
jgi:hypothetical protein